MKKILSILMITVLAGGLNAQDPTKDVTVKPSIENMEEVMNDFVYPLEARKNGIEGCVEVQFVVDQNGDLVKARIKHACDPLFRKAVKEVLDQFEFTPATINGNAVAGMVTVPFNFELDVE